MKYDTALFISALLYERLSYGEMAANDDTIYACLCPAATCEGLSWSAAPCVVAGCYRLRCFNRLLVFPVLVDNM